ncbi:MAG: bifunctional folylpolyglutamate synthase/dihydrofolate synthase [Beijerinckiaceae bacterium]|nr:bifunctional folylpolyglutamate synthase/dihydrofolate synthase [Beijerinckiaceae bacterium]
MTAGRDGAASDAFMARFLALHPKKIDLSLGRTERLLAALGDPHKRLPPTIHVAGTNGKGSTVAFMRAMLESAGKRVHVYTSPHLVRFHERIRLAGTLVSEAQLADAFARCERANAGEPITLFEITTAAAFLLFAQTPADALLLEVGLGGRFDSTNVIDAPAASVITPVSMDHMDFLGDTLAKIAFEKAGILKRGATAIIGPQDDEALAVIERQAARVRAPLLVAGRDFHISEEGGRLAYEDARGLLDLPLPRLQGRHQHENAANAVAAVRMAFPSIASTAIEAGVREAEWPARMQSLTRGALIDLAPAGAELWLDGGHNPAGGLALAAAMAEFEARNPRPLVLVSGMLASKDMAGLLAPFAGLAREVYCVPMSGDSQAHAPAEMAAAASAMGLKAIVSPGIPDALRAIAGRPWPVAPRILIAGSLYLAGEVLRANGTIPH